MIKILIGGSPCTFWSIAQRSNREVEAKGLGWELFKNYLIAKEKFQPDFFLYENNKSAAQPIKDQISRELGVELMHINNSLVSAQNRQRFYAFNWHVDQPADRGICLKDILQSQTDEKGYELRAPAVGVGCRNRREDDGKLYRRFETSAEEKANALTTVQTDSMVAEPIRIGTIENDAKTQSHDSKQYRVYSPEGKATTLCGEGGGLGAKTGLYAAPIKVGEIGNGGQDNRIYSAEGKTVAITAQSGGVGSNTGLYAYRTEGQNGMVVQTPDGQTHPIYEVVNGEVEIKGKKYPIKLEDGLYIIRKLTPVECERCQTLPDGYTAAVSNTQRYRGLGNGWTAEVIIHILTGALKDVPRDEEIVVLSMYDGIGTGRYCLDKMGFTNVTYYAYEIDEPAMKVALSNYPDIIELGDAFNLRRDDWELGKIFEGDPPSGTPTTDVPEEITDDSDDLDGCDDSDEVETGTEISVTAEAVDEPTDDEQEEPEPPTPEQTEPEQSASDFLRTLSIMAIKAMLRSSRWDPGAEFFEKLKTATPQEMVKTIGELPVYIAAHSTMEAMKKATPEQTDKEVSGS